MSIAGRGSDQFMLRFPKGMRGLVKNEAARNNRSMNSELIYQLQRLYGVTEATGEGLDAQIPAASSDTTALQGGASHPRL